VVDLLEVNAADEHTAVVRTHETQQQPQDRALAGAARADQRYPFAGLNAEGEVLETAH
jgi:hypothetical protein